MIQLNVYFAHAKPDYGTYKEETAIKIIENNKLNLYGDEIQLKVVNPGDLQYRASCVSNLMDYWFGVVRQCHILVFMKFEDGYITAGVGQAVNLALKLGLPVYELDLMPYGAGNVQYVYGVKRVPEPTTHMSVKETRELFNRLKEFK